MKYQKRELNLAIKYLTGIFTLTELSKKLGKPKQTTNQWIAPRLKEAYREGMVGVYKEIDLKFGYKVNKKTND